MFLISILDVNGNAQVNRTIRMGEVVPVNPVPERGDVSIVMDEPTAKKVADYHLGNIPYCRKGSTSYRGEMAEFVYLNMRGKTL